MRRINRTRILTRKSRRELTIIIFIFSCLFLGIGYAYFNDILIVDERVNLTNASWNIYFDNVSPKVGNITNRSEVTIKDKTSLNINVILENPGDIFSFDVDIVNAGPIDAVLSKITKTELTSEQQEYLEYTITHQNQESLVKNSILEKNSRETINITIKYKNKAKNITKDEKIDLSLTLEYLQDKKI